MRTDDESELLRSLAHKVIPPPEIEADVIALFGEASEQTRYLQHALGRTGLVLGRRVQAWQNWQWSFSMPLYTLELPDGRDTYPRPRV